MPLIIRLALTADILAIVCERILPAAHAVLPLGGDHFVQTAAFVLVAAAGCELLEMVKRKPKR